MTRSARHSGARFGRLLGGLVGAAVFGLACTSTSGPFAKRSPPTGAPGAEERPQLPAEYDVLVAELAELEGDVGSAREAYARASEKDPDSAYLHRRQAELAGKQADLLAATRHASRAVELDPDDLAMRLFLGRSHESQGHLAEAYWVLVDEDGNPLSLAAGLLLFQIYLERGDLPNALVMSEKIADQYPDELAMFMARATVYERMGDYRTAERTLREALELYPDRYLIYGRIARLRRASGDLQGEIALYEELLVLEPNDYGTLRGLGEALIGADDIDGAIQVYERIIEIYPDDFDSLRRITGLEFSRGRHAEAAARIEAFLGDRPGDAEMLYALGQVKRGAGDLVGAHEVFLQVPPESELYLDARLQIAILHEEKGDYDAALIEVESVREQRADRTLDFHAAALHARSGNLEAGLAILQAMQEEKPDDVEVLYQIGVLYGAPPARRTDDALEFMLRVIEIDPGHAQALNYVAYSWVERGENIDEAEKMIRRALVSRPQDGYILDSLGWVYYMRARSLALEGRHGDALPFLEKAREKLVRAAELTGGDPVVSEHLGDVYLLMDEKPRALEFYEDAVSREYRPAEQPDLIEKLETLKRELGRP